MKFYLFSYRKKKQFFVTKVRVYLIKSKLVVSVLVDVIDTKRSMSPITNEQPFAIWMYCNFSSILGFAINNCKK